jgi:hypothetical protein
VQNLKQGEMSKMFKLKYFLFTRVKQLEHSPQGNFASPSFATLGAGPDFAALKSLLRGYFRLAAK